MMPLSKKLTTVAVAMSILIADAQGYIEMSDEHVHALTWVMIAYIGGQSLIDAILAKKSKAEVSE